MIRAMRLMGAGALPLFLGFLLNRLLLAFPAAGLVRVPLSVCFCLHGDILRSDCQIP